MINYVIFDIFYIVGKVGALVLPVNLENFDAGALDLTSKQVAFVGEVFWGEWVRFDIFVDLIAYLHEQYTLAD
jgi:hypothetical protein